MSYTTEQVLSHIDSIIDRQQQDIDEMISLKFSKKKIQIERAKDALSNLRTFRYQIASGLKHDQKMLLSIVRDMKEIGW